MKEMRLVILLIVLLATCQYACHSFMMTAMHRHPSRSSCSSLRSSSEMMRLQAAAAVPAPSQGKANITISFPDLIRESRRTGDFGLAVQKADLWLEKNKNWSPGGLTSCCTIYGLANKHEKLKVLLASVQARGIVLNTQQTNAFMTAFVRCRDVQAASAMFAALGEEERDAYSYGIMLSAFEKKGQWREALALFRTVDEAKKTLPLFNTLLSCLSKTKQFELAIQVYDELKARQYSSNIQEQEQVVVGDETTKKIMDVVFVSMRSSGKGNAKQGQQQQQAKESKEEDDDVQVLRKMPEPVREGTLFDKLSEQPAALVSFLFASNNTHLVLLLVEKLAKKETEKNDVLFGSSSSSSSSSTSNSSASEKLLRETFNAAFKAASAFKKTHSSSIGSSNSSSSNIDELVALLFARMISMNISRTSSTYKYLNSYFAAYSEQERAHQQQKDSFLQVVVNQAQKDGFESHILLLKQC